MEKVYFYNGSESNRSYSIGLLSTIIHATYIRGKELGCDDIILEWHHNIPYPHWIHAKGTMMMPKKIPLKMRFVRKGRRLNCDSIDISKPNSLYDGCPPLINKMAPSCNYLNKRYIETGKRPIFDVDKEKYILFHYRYSPEPKQKIRNTPIDVFERIFNELKEEYKDYEFHKIGEKSAIDNLFDVVHPYYSNDIGKLYNLIAKAEKFIGNESAPAYISYMFNTPSIILEDEQTNKLMKKDVWMDSDYEKFGEHQLYWSNEDNIKRIPI